MELVRAARCGTAVDPDAVGNPTDEDELAVEVVERAQSERLARARPCRRARVRRSPARSGSRRCRPARPRCPRRPRRRCPRGSRPGGRPRRRLRSLSDGVSRDREPSVPATRPLRHVDSDRGTMSAPERRHSPPSEAPMPADRAPSVLITGIHSELGFAISHRFRREGWFVIGCDHGTTTGRNARVHVSADLTHEEDCRRAAARRRRCSATASTASSTAPTSGWMVRSTSSARRHGTS